MLRVDNKHLTLLSFFYFLKFPFILSVVCVREREHARVCVGMHTCTSAHKCGSLWGQLAGVRDFVSKLTSHIGAWSTFTVNAY